MFRDFSKRLVFNFIGVFMWQNTQNLKQPAFLLNENFGLITKLGKRNSSQTETKKNYRLLSKVFFCVLQQGKTSSPLEVLFIIRIIMVYLKISIQLCFVTHSGPFLQTGTWYSLLRQRHVLRLEVSGHSLESNAKIWRTCKIWAGETGATNTWQRKTEWLKECLWKTHMLCTDWVSLEWKHCRALCGLMLLFAVISNTSFIRLIAGALPNILLQEGKTQNDNQHLLLFWSLPAAA